MPIRDIDRSVKTEKYPYAHGGYRKGATIQWTVALDKIGSQAAYFAVTGEVQEPRRRDVSSCGCLHDFGVALKGHDAMLPEIVRWHLTSVADGPMHYEANALYWFEQGNLDYFRNACVFGAVAGDEMPATLAEATVFLRSRKPALMAAFERDMVRFFGEDVREGLSLPPSSVVDATEAPTEIVAAG